MNYLILSISLLLLVLIKRNIEKKSKILSWILFIYFGIYIILLPLLYITGMDFISIDKSKDLLDCIIYSNSIFLLVLYGASYLVLILFPISKAKSLKIDIFNVKTSKLIIPFIIFFMITYISKSYLYGTFLYPFSNIASFQLAQEYKKGGWFFLVISGMFWYFFMIYLYKISFLNRSKVWIKLILGLLFLTLILQFSARSSLLILLIAFFIYRFEYLSYKKIQIVSIKWVLLAFLSVSFLVLFDRSRQGLDITFQDIINIFSIELIQGFLISFLQVENSVELVYYFNTHDFIGIEKLLLVLSGYALLPSFILPFEKVDTGIEAILTNMIFGNNLNPIFYQSNSTLTFSIPMTGYAEFGYLGVLIHSSIYSIILSLSIFSYGKKGFLSFIFLVFSVQTILAFRLSTASVLNSLYIYIIFIGLLIILYKLTLSSKRGR